MAEEVQIPVITDFTRIKAELNELLLLSRQLDTATAGLSSTTGARRRPAGGGISELDAAAAAVGAGGGLSRGRGTKNAVPNAKAADLIIPIDPKTAQEIASAAKTAKALRDAKWQVTAGPSPQGLLPALDANTQLRAGANLLRGNVLGAALRVGGVSTAYLIAAKVGLEVGAATLRRSTDAVMALRKAQDSADFWRIIDTAAEKAGGAAGLEILGAGEIFAKPARSLASGFGSLFAALSGAPPAQVGAIRETLDHVNQNVDRWLNGKESLEERRDRKQTEHDRKITEMVRRSQVRHQQLVEATMEQIHGIGFPGSYEDLKGWITSRRADWDAEDLVKAVDQLGKRKRSSGEQGGEDN